MVLIFLIMFNYHNEIYIYILQSDYENSFFIKDYSKNKNNSIEPMDWLWQKPKQYTPLYFKRRVGDKDKKNYKSDISTTTNPLIIISENTWHSLKDILEPRGVLLDIITESKRKKFFGYYPKNSVTYGSLDLELSDYSDYSKDSFYPSGKMVRKAVLKESKIDRDYIFSIAESPMKIFVDGKFKKRVEEAGLICFDFSYEIELST